MSNQPSTNLRAIIVSITFLGLSFLFPHPASGNIVKEPTVNQIDPGSAVVSWETALPATSMVRYQSASLGLEQVTPQYSTYNRFHQVKISGLGPETYTFVAVSVSSDGRVFQSPPVTLRLQVSFPLPPAGEEDFPPRQSSALKTLPVAVIKEVKQAYGSLIPRLTLWRESFAARQGSVSFLLLAWAIAGAIFLIERLTLLVVGEWFLALAALRLGRKRRDKNVFTVFDGRTNKPLPGAEVLVIQPFTKAVLKTYTTDPRGQVFFQWPLDQPVLLRVTHRGYQALKKMIVREVEDLMLTPLPQIISPRALKLSRAKFIFSHSLRTLHLATLAIGTLLLAFSLASKPDVLFLATATGYLILWWRVLRILPRRYHLAQVVDRKSQKPVAAVELAAYRPHGPVDHLLSNPQGYVAIPYPIPEFISLTKPGYVGVLRQTIPATAIGPDPLILSLQPKE